MCVACDIKAATNKLHAKDTDLAKELTADRTTVSINRGSLIDFLADYTLTVNATGIPSTLVLSIVRSSIIELLFADNKDKGAVVYQDIIYKVVRRVEERVKATAQVKSELIDIAHDTLKSMADDE